MIIRSLILILSDLLENNEYQSDPQFPLMYNRQIYRHLALLHRERRFVLDIATKALEYNGAVFNGTSFKSPNREFCRG